MNKLSVIDGETLLDMDLNAPRFCVQNFLPQGLSILGGAPKMGKSWLVLDLRVRIAKLTRISVAVSMVASVLVCVVWHLLAG